MKCANILMLSMGIILYGCDDNERTIDEELIGDWILHKSIKVSSDTSYYFSPPNWEIFDTLMLKSDITYEWSVLNIIHGYRFWPNQDSLYHRETGTWEAINNNLIFDIKKINGHYAYDPDRIISYILDEDTMNLTIGTMTDKENTDWRIASIYVRQ